MTYEEAANILDPVKRESALLKYDSFERLGKLKEACQIAAEMLRNATEIKTGCNKPLTLEQLRERNGLPVWVHVIDHTVFADKQDDFDGWGMCRKSWVRIWDSKRADLIHIDYDFEDYGKEWIAYAYSPAHIDRKAWDDCPVCEKYKEISFRGFRTKEEAMDLSGKVHPHITGGAMFCPKCGKPRNERAWADLEQRLRGVR